ncbi:hypothetical protein [Agromyces atrinae]|uniref:PAS domain-containing protein n=1 Tax=Agromyces atrinae TaxID=592376 RepID=A0A4V1R2B9_9MICO|nr:hypothetical protein [Agromyces atrinae]NYD66289.1 PAS domain-containing protein [Agromyces atrinae]RXZ86616.1 hypothetical protein ESP50_09495 [Agromyces atrinae]
MPAHPDWIAHRRGDGEMLGWMLPDGEGFVVIDLLGRPRTPPLEWLDAEEMLEATGIGYLADPYELRLDDGRWLRVRIVEVSTDVVRVKKEDWGAVDMPGLHYTVPFPVDERLRTLA